MGILKALLARACIPLCFIQTLKFESGQLLPSDILFLHVLMTFTTVWICEIILAEPELSTRNRSRVFIGTFFIVSMFLAFFLTHVAVKESDTRKYLLIDYGFPFLNFNQLLQWTCYEIWYLMFFIYSYLKALGLGPVKIVCYLFYLGMHAVVVIFILEAITLTAKTEFYFALRDNFYYTFDANTSDAYPDGYLHPLVLDKGLYEKATMTTEIYTCPLDLYSTCSLTSLRKDDEYVKFPLKHNMLYRYTGEDVEMVCDYSLTPYTITAAKLQPPVWYFNESAIENSSRHIILNTYHQTGESVNVASSLKIKYLKDADFGEYICSCAIKSSSSYIEDQFGYLAEEYTIKKPSINVLVLNQIKMQPKLIYRVVGNIITSENFFWYNSEADINDMSISYTVNDRPVEEVCPGLQTQTCSIGATILRTFIRVGAQRFDWNGAVEFPFIELGEVPAFGVKRGIVYFCLCSSGFGIHRISFLRKVYSGLTKKYRNEEIVHPFVFVVMPLSTISVFRFYDDTHLYSKIEKLVNEEENFDIIEDAVTDLIEFITANEEKVLTQANVIQSILLILSVIICYMLTLFVSNVYMQVFIEYVPRRVFMPQLMLPEVEPVLAIESEQYDVFLSHSEEEYTFVTETLLPFLENDCELRVCLPNRDFPPNMGIFGSYVDRIWKSRKVIVILSQAYMAEARCRYLQLEHIILPLLYQELRAQKDVLIIKYEERVVLPEPLRWNFQIEVFPWYRQLPARVKLQTLKKWVLTGHI